MTDEPEPIVVDLLAEDFHEHAHDIYDRLRTQSPVAWVRLPQQPGRGFWMVTGYSEAEAALRDPRLANDPRTVLSADEIAARPETQHVGAQATMLFSDPPEHTRLRRIAQRAFSPRFVAALRPSVIRHAERLLDAAEQTAADGAVDLLHAFAYPLPIAVIGEMLGYPEAWHADLQKFAVRAATESTPLAAPDEGLRAQLEGYGRDLIALRRDDPADDLVSRMLHPGPDQETLTETEIMAMIGLLTAAGFETTAGLIGSATLALMTHRTQWADLCENPELAGPAVEETLRYWGPVESAMMRFAAEPFDLGGKHIATGDTVLAFPAAANRDPAHVTDPHRFDIRRTSRGHLGFGGGIHTCLGTALARTEGRIALTTLTRRWPELQLAVPPSELRWRPGMGLRGLRRLPVRPSPA
ncbi:cytochrome P450 family protein [Nocardia thraciensis]